MTTTPEAVKSATDEQIAEWKSSAHVMPSDYYQFILSLIARVETAPTATTTAAPEGE